jgi:hypothetical protein
MAKTKFTEEQLTMLKNREDDWADGDPDERNEIYQQVAEEVRELYTGKKLPKLSDVTEVHV